MGEKTIKCRAAILYKESLPMVVEEILVDAPGAGQVRVKMVAAGVCASDAHYVWGEQKLTEIFGDVLPMVMGHEGSGIVESVGPNVTKVKPGDHVLLAFTAECEKCPTCVNPHTNVCVKDNTFVVTKTPNRKCLDGKPIYGFLGTGVFSQFVLCAASQVVKIDEQADLIPACIVSCAVGTGFYSAVNLAQVYEGSTCAIWGLGAIGLNAVFGCKYRKAANIVGIDLNNDKKQMALEMGCTEFVNPSELDQPIDQYLKEKYGFGVDFAFDCFGSKQVIDQALKCLSLWGTMAVVGVPHFTTLIEYPALEILNGRKIVGAFLGNKKPNQAFPQLINMFVKGEYPVNRLVTHQFHLEQINEAFQTLKDGKCIRSVITF